MAGDGRTRPVTKFRLARSELPLIGESGHRNFDAKPCVYEFANGCLRPKAEVRGLGVSGAMTFL